MSDPYFVSIESQQNFFFVLRIIFCVSIVLHSISLIFLIKFTPKNLTTWRNYMLFVQGCLIAIDVYMEMLFVMVPLFPAPCGYCIGPLCRLDVPLQIQTGIGFVLLGFLNTATIFCVFHRHQSILVSANIFRLGKTWKRIVHFLLIIAPAIPNIYFCANLQTQEVTDKTVREDPRNLTWIMDRGCYFCLKKIMYHKIFVVQVILLLLFTTSWMIFMFVHMNHILNIDSHKRSAQATKNIRKSITRLFFQLVTPLLMMAIPATVIIFALAADGLIDGFGGLITFEQSLSLFTAILCHSTVHDLFLLSLTPSYRNKIINIFKYIVLLKSCDQNHGNQPPPSVAPYETAKSTRQVSFVKIVVSEI